MLLNKSLVDRVLDSKHLLLALEGLSGGLWLHDPLKLGLKGCGQVLGQDGWLLHLLGIRTERAKARGTVTPLTRRLSSRGLTAQTRHRRSLPLEFWGT